MLAKNQGFGAVGLGGMLAVGLLLALPGVGNGYDGMPSATPGAVGGNNGGGMGPGGSGGISIAPASPMGQACSEPTHAVTCDMHGDELCDECACESADITGHSSHPPGGGGNLPGASGVPVVRWAGAGLNRIGAVGPDVVASVNGRQASHSVRLSTGAAQVIAFDLVQRMNGLDWFHRRVYSSTNLVSGGWAGEGWWVDEMMNISVSGTEGASDCTVELDPNHSLEFTYDSGAWTCDENLPYTLTFSSGDDEYTVTRVDGRKWVFHDSQHTDAGRIKQIEDAYGNDWAFTYSSGDLDYIVVDVVEGDDHKFTYTYFTSGDNDGLLQYVKVYKSTTVQASDLIAQVEYVYHDSDSDGAEEFGSEDDLLKVIISRKATADGDGTLSIQNEYHYRYYEGTYDSGTNPGTDHLLRYVLLPENGDRLDGALGDPLTQTNANFEDYANIIYEYDTNDRVRQTEERLPGAGCGCGGAGGAPAVTEYAWTANGGSPDLDTWNLHLVADRADDSRVIADFNTANRVLTWVVQDEDDGSPNYELIWHFDYGTSVVPQKYANVS